MDYNNLDLTPDYHVLQYKETRSWLKKNNFYTNDKKLY